MEICLPSCFLWQIAHSTRFLKLLGQAFGFPSCPFDRWTPRGTNPLLLQTFKSGLPENVGDYCLFRCLYWKICLPGFSVDSLLAQKRPWLNNNNNDDISWYLLRFSFSPCIRHSFPPTTYVKIFIMWRHNFYCNILRDSNSYHNPEGGIFPYSWGPFQLYVSEDTKLSPSTGLRCRNPSIVLGSFFIFFCLSLWSISIPAAHSRVSSRALASSFFPSMSRRCPGDIISDVFRCSLFENREEVCSLWWLEPMGVGG